MNIGSVMIDLAGEEISSEEREMLLHPAVGGVILFTRNYQSPEQIKELVAEIHAIRHPSLLVAVDHEGGRVQRFRNGFTELPPAAALQTPRLAELAGWLMAIELRSVGVDFSFAPVLDLDYKTSKVIGDRSFARDPEQVAELAQGYMRGMHKAGMKSVGKHFPGHGWVAPDSHLELPQDERSFADIELEDLLPFERLVHYGMEAIMPAHIVFPKVDPEFPVGFSPRWIGDILRTQLNFQGAVFTDDLSMAGAASVGAMPERARQALTAGCDMVLLCNQHKTVGNVRGEVLQELEDYHNYASTVRLARMHGTNKVNREKLLRSVNYQQIVNSVRNLEGPHSLEMEL